MIISLHTGEWVTFVLETQCLFVIQQRDFHLLLKWRFKANIYYRNEICLASFRETCHWSKFPLNWLRAQSSFKSSGRIAAFSLWTGMFRDVISSVPGETVIPL